MKYSVIIPVYNSEKTIKRCVESIVLQNRADVELIIINDGSTDETESICNQLKTQHSNIIYIHKENGGVSSSRNVGLSVATGEFVMFVDSDDYLDNGCFDAIDKYIQGGADYYQFGFSIVENGVTKEVRVPSDCVASTLTDKEAFISEGIIKRSINSPWAKLFRREIINENNLRFCEDLSIGEDLTFVFTFLLSARKIEGIAYKIYFADIGNGESLSRKYREGLSEQLICVYNNMIEALNKTKTESSRINESLSWLFYRNAYSVIKDFSKVKSDFFERRKKLMAMCSLFNNKRVTPIGLKCKIIALPIQLRLMGLTDIAFRVINKLK